MDIDPSDMEPNQNIIYITEEEHRSEWTYDATKELLKIYDEKSDMLETGIITTQKRLWELTSKALAKKGFYYTGPQCENKWKALKRSYRAKLERMEKFGSCKRACPFEYEVAEILSKRPNDSITRSYSLKINELKKQEDIFSVNLNEPPGDVITIGRAVWVEKHFFGYQKLKKIIDFFGPQSFANVVNNVKAETGKKFSKPQVTYFKAEHDNDDIKNLTLFHENSGSSVPEMQASGSEPTYTVIQESNQTLLAEELSDLKKIIYKHNKVNTQILKQSTEVQEKIFECLERTVLAQNQSLKLEETKIAQQNEIIQQMKCQNALLEKLLDKLS